MGRPSRLSCVAVGLTCLLGLPRPAGALEVSGTLRLGVFQVGTTSLFAVTPALGLRLGPARGVNLSLQDDLVLFPGPRNPFGLDNRFSAGVGYSAGDWDVDAGASLSAYWMYACGDALCGRVVGLAPGARVRVSYFPAGFLGVAVSGDVGWYGGRSLVLPGGPAFSVAAGPVFRWTR